MTVRIALFTAFFPPAYKAGGPVRSTANIVATAPEDCSLLIVTGDRDLGETEPFDLPTGTPQQWGRHTVMRVNPRAPRQLARMIRAVRTFSPSIIYVNSLWSPWFSMLPAAISSIRLWAPEMLLIAPRGELQASSLAIKPTKKRAATYAWRLMRTFLNVWWHATDNLEEKDIQQFFNGNEKILTSLNPVDLPPTPRTHFSVDRDHLEFVVAGRISPKKNQLAIMRALVDVCSPIVMHIYGVVHDHSYNEELLQLAEEVPPRHHIIFHGAVEHEALLTAMNGADGMLLPTLGENFGHVIPEALSQSCPVYAGDVTPFSITLRNGGGAIVDNESPTAWAQLINSLAQEDRKQRAGRHAAAAQAYLQWRNARETTNILDMAHCALETPPRTHGLAATSERGSAAHQAVATGESSPGAGNE